MKEEHSRQMKHQVSKAVGKINWGKLCRAQEAIGFILRMKGNYCKDEAGE